MITKAVHRWVHRRGIAQVVSSGSASNHDMGRAVVEVRAPHWAVPEMAIFAVRHSSVVAAYWDTISVSKIYRKGRYHYLVTMDYVRVRTTL